MLDPSRSRSGQFMISRSSTPSFSQSDGEVIFLHDVVVRTSEVELDILAVRRLIRRKPVELNWCKRNMTKVRIQDAK